MIRVIILLWAINYLIDINSFVVSLMFFSVKISLSNVLDLSISLLMLSASVNKSKKVPKTTK